MILRLVVINAILLLVAPIGGVTIIQAIVAFHSCGDLPRQKVP